MKHAELPVRSLIAAIVAAGALAACGGGSNDGAGISDSEREDQAASASVAGLIGFAAGQVDHATDETSEPRSIANITPPADETSEPFLI